MNISGQWEAKTETNLLENNSCQALNSNNHQKIYPYIYNDSQLYQPKIEYKSQKVSAFHLM